MLSTHCRFLYTGGFAQAHAMADTLASIAIPCPLRRRFDYLWPASLQRDIQPGTRVKVPFGRRDVIAVVLGPTDNTDVDASKLKAVIEVLDEQASLSTALLDLGKWAAHYYHHPIGDCLHQMLPLALRRSATPTAEDTAAWQLRPNADIAKLSPRAHQQCALFNALLENGPLTRADITALGFSASIVRALQQHALIEEAEPSSTPAPAEQGPTLNSEQADALQQIIDSDGQFARFLLDGITGSGKTEVYLRAIAHALANGKQALVLVPEIGLTPQTLRRFEQRFPGRVRSLHSGLSERQRWHNWQAAREGRADIILGTRSAVFADLPRLGLVIVDEEHDSSYKQQDGWRYSARDIAVKRAADSQCPVILGSATPSFDSLHNADLGRYRVLRLRQRAGNACEAPIRLLDIRQQALQHGLSDALLSAVANNLRAGNQSLLFLNRRGFAPTLQCHCCGWIADCHACDARMTVHYKRRQLRCHHCEAVRAMPASCPDCGNSQWIYDGPGTERLEMFLNQHFDAPVLRIDRDTTAGRDSMAELVKEVNKGDPCILVGTQMLAKGHHFPAVTLVGIVDMDAGLFSADYRATENSAQLLLQVAGRAGRADRPGEVLLQTHCPAHPALQSLSQHGYRDFAAAQLAERRLLDLPPYTFSAVIRCDAPQLHDAEQFLQQLRNSLQPPAPGWQLLGPLPAPMARRAGRFRASLILQASERRTLHQQLAVACNVAESLSKRGQLRWSVDVDPIEMF